MAPPPGWCLMLTEDCIQSVLSSKECHMVFSCWLGFLPFHSLWVPRGSVPRVNVPKSRRKKLPGQLKLCLELSWHRFYCYLWVKSNHRSQSDTREQMRKRQSHTAEESRDGRHHGTHLWKIEPATVTTPVK